MPDEERPKPKPGTIEKETITKGDKTPPKTYEIKDR